MNRLELGDVVKTNYGTGPYCITKIVRGCRCSTFIEEGDGIYTLPEHVHLTVRHTHNSTNCQEEGKDCFLNYYDEASLKSVRGEAFLILVPTGQLIQTTLF